MIRTMPMKKEIAQIISEITDSVREWEPRLRSLSFEILTGKRNKQNRTIKQILGHMADSATNNTHRIIHLQYQNSPVNYPDYANLGNNDRWISIQDYQGEDWDLLVDLWAATNRHIAHVISQVDENKLNATWISALGEEITLEAMIEDYPRHFRLHLEEIETILSSL